ncbi:hypothetical protein JCM19000A_31490 [Silvimonas sp. JCM 19000]
MTVPQPPLPDQRAGGVFFSHIDTPRVRAHFARLAAESAPWVQWRLVFNRSRFIDLDSDLAIADPATVLPQRHAQMLRNDGVQRGLLDAAMLPCLLALPQPQVWFMEYDVDFAGNWADLFSQYHAEPADLLSSSLRPRDRDIEWFHWQQASAPAAVDPHLFCRGFHPLIRVSRTLALAYQHAVADPAWAGHYEFILPTVAAVCGLRTLDLARRPGQRLARNYLNTPSEPFLAPGTYVWRPARPAYFHEDPASFELPNLLYHPIKTDNAAWGRRDDE